jgi:hypothetical protein
MGDDFETWQQLLQKYPDDDDLLGLFALHSALCGMVEAGSIDEERASRIFEGWRERLRREWAREEDRPL